MELTGSVLQALYKHEVLPGLANVYITMERSTIFNGKIHYFYGHFK